MKCVVPVTMLLVNAILLGLFIASVIADSNDKTPIVFIFGYLLILCANLALWGIVSIFNNKKLTHQLGKGVLILSILFVFLLIFTLVLF